MAATVTPTDLNVWRPKMGERRTRFIHTQRTIEAGCILTETNQTHSDPLLLIGCSRGATGKLRARARARAQTGLLYIEPLVCLWGLRAVKNARDRAFAARAVVSKIRTGAWEIQPDSEFGLHRMFGERIENKVLKHTRPNAPAFFDTTHPARNDELRRRQLRHGRE